MALINIQASALGVGETGLWTFDGPQPPCVGGAPVINSPTNPISTVTVFCPGTYTFKWTVSKQGCPPVEVPLTKYVFEPPVSNAGPDFSVCALTASLGGNLAAAGSTGTWSQISGPGTTIFANPNLNTTSFTVSVIGTYVFQWSVANTNPLSPCPVANDTVTVTIGTPPVVNAGPDQSVCNSTECPTSDIYGINTTKPSYPAINQSNADTIQQVSGAGYNVTTGPFTIGAWVRPYSITPGGIQTVLDHIDPATGAGVRIQISAAGQATATISDGTNTTTLTCAFTIPTANAQNSIYLVRDGAGNVSLVVNGTACATAAGAAWNIDNASPLIWGAQRDPASMTLPYLSTDWLRGDIASITYGNSYITPTQLRTQWTNSCASIAPFQGVPTPPPVNPFPIVLIPSGPTLPTSANPYTGLIIDPDGGSAQTTTIVCCPPPPL